MKAQDGRGGSCFQFIAWPAGDSMFGSRCLLANGLSYGRYPNTTVPVGTSIRFVWSGLHGVYSIPRSACPLIFPPGMRFPGAVGLLALAGILSWCVQPVLLLVRAGNASLAGISAGGSYTTAPLTEKGTNWYACQVPGHCLGGQVIYKPLLPLHVMT